MKSLFDTLLALIGVLVLLALIGLAAMGAVQVSRGETLLPTPTPEATEVAVLPTSTPEPVTPTITLTPTEQRPPTETPRATRTPRPTRTPGPATPTWTPSPSPEATITPEPSATPRPTPQATNHYWFARPIGPDAVDEVETFYPYGSTGEGAYPIHHGVEFVNEIGTPVRAVAPGTVALALNDESLVVGPPDWNLRESGAFYGNVVIIAHDQEYNGERVYTLYGHMQSLAVRGGQRVDTGTVIGMVGMSGIALGPHLHFEVRVGANDYLATRNPQLWLIPQEGNGTIIGQVLDAQGNPVPEAFMTIQRADEEQVFRSTYSYAAGPINPDDEWNENFLLGDIPAGEWRIAARVGEQTLVRNVTVRPGETSWVWLAAQQ
jgi:murein DD-endopeptidase MepM/ murein hydrolase activator NlpD